MVNEWVWQVVMSGCGNWGNEWFCKGYEWVWQGSYKVLEATLKCFVMDEILKNMIADLFLSVG